MQRKWVWMTLIAGVAAAAAAYTPARQFHRFFLTECAADGPAPETELDIDVEPLPLEPFYRALREALTEGAFITRAKSWLRIYTLGEYTTSLGIPPSPVKCRGTGPASKNASKPRRRC